MSDEQINQVEQQDENKLIALRRQKLENIRNSNRIAFPNKFRPTNNMGELQNYYKNTSKEELDIRNVQTSVAGRLMLDRGSFLVLQDSTDRIQVYVDRKNLNEQVLAFIKELDLGDIIGINGTLHRSGKGDLYIKIKNIQLLTKALRSLPDKYHGLSDAETRYRMRYVDLITNNDSRRTFQIRSQIISFIRKFLTEEYGFMEVETPMLQSIPGGAAAKPFETYHNALDLPMFLRIAPELYLKRLIVGGFERVFEINRNFRNEGVSARHNPEFTMIEWYWAYTTFEDNIKLTQELFRGIAEKVMGTTIITYQNNTFDFSKPFDRLTIFDAILKYNPHIKAEDLQNKDKLISLINTIGLDVKGHEGIGKLQTMIFEETVEEKLINPTFITHYPFEVSPLARRNDDNPEVTDRFELFIGGREIANAFSELNDAEDQASRFLQQVTAKNTGDDEAMYYDADYIRALEYGMPPTSGQGIGIDRLIMLFTDSYSIRDVILFPHMRPENQQ